jgi:hypothetical protein
MTPSLHTPFFAQRTRAKEKKKERKSSVQSLPFLLLLLSLHNRSNSTIQERRDAYPTAAEDAGHNLKNAEAPRHENR